MRVENLIATMDRTDLAILEEMRIQADAVVVNQCSQRERLTLDRKGRRVVLCSLPERGVGRSRNRALELARGDILLFSDDDLVYADGYEDLLIDAFRSRPDMDVLIFNLRNDARGGPDICRPHRMRWYNYMRYGAARLAVRRDAVIGNKLRFSTQFGGGARYGSGEDSLFLRDCLRKGLQLYALPLYLATTNGRASTWFTGYNEQYYADKGALYAALAGRLGVALCLRHALVHRGEFGPDCSARRGLACMLAGLRRYLKENARE